MEGAVRNQGFTLLELLVVTSLLALLLSLAYWYLAPIRQKAYLVAGQAYVRSVAIDLEARRDPSTGSLLTHVTDCAQGFGEKPRSVATCTISYPTNSTFVIEATLQGTAASRIRYEEGVLVTLP